MGRELQEFMESWLGSDWEERLIIGGATADEGATDDEVGAARERAVALIREQNPELTDEQADWVRDAWVQLWVDVGPRP